DRAAQSAQRGTELALDPRPRSARRAADHARQQQGRELEAPREPGRRWRTAPRVSRAGAFKYLTLNVYFDPPGAAANMDNGISFASIGRDLAPERRSKDRSLV